MSISTLTVVRPVAVTPAMLVASNVPEDDQPAWSSSVTYAAGALVVYQHLIYESLAAGNVNNVPTATPDKWTSRGATNRWRMFDESISSQTKRASSISYELKVGSAINYIALLNISGASSVRIRVTHPTYGLVYDRTQAIKRTPVAVGWWQWWFGDRREQTQVMFSNVPAVPGASILIDIVGGSALGVGVAVLGMRRDFSLGVRMGASVGIVDYSRKDRTDWGDIVVVERAFSSRANFSMLLRAREVDAFKAFLAEGRAKACLWVGSSRYESTTIYGFYKSLDILINYFDYSDCELELESLT